MKTVIFGAGYVGSVTAGCLTKLGHEVWLIDTLDSKIDAISKGRSPVVERDLDQLIATAVQSGRLRAGKEPGQVLLTADLAIVCVGTPSLLNGLIDTRALHRVLQAIETAAQSRTQPLPVVIRSTILAPVLRSILAAIAPSGRELCIQVVSNPEFLRETSAVSDFFHPPFIVVGGDHPQALDTALDLYKGIDAPRHRVSLETASMLKYACNSFHALKIAFANEIDTLATLMKADGRQVMRLLTKDTILNISAKYLQPGFAFGGSCLPKDLRALEALGREHHEPLSLISSLLPSNRRRIEQAFEVIASQPGQRLAFLGLSFKKGTDDLRESAYLELAEKLIGKGFELRIYDPDLDAGQLVGANRAQALQRLPHMARILVNSPEAACDQAEGVVICKCLMKPEEVKRIAPSDALIYDLDRMDELIGLKENQSALSTLVA